MRIQKRTPPLPPKDKRSPAGTPSADGRRAARALVLILSAVIPLIVISCRTLPPAGTADPYAGTSWDQLRESLSGPKEVEDYLRGCPVRYKEEKPGVLNHTQTPEETLRLKTGDCEDFAYVIVDALTYHGYEARILSVEAKTRTGLVIHAVAVYRDKETGQWHYIHAYDFKGLGIGVSNGFGSECDMAEYVAKKLGGSLHRYFVMTPELFIRMYDAMIN